MAADTSEFVRDFETLRREDTPVAGGKGANLGEMTAALGDEQLRLLPGPVLDLNWSRLTYEQAAELAPHLKLSLFLFRRIGVLVHMLNNNVS